MVYGQILVILYKLRECTQTSTSACVPLSILDLKDILGWQSPHLRPGRRMFVLHVRPMSEPWFSIVSPISQPEQIRESYGNFI